MIQVTSCEQALIKTNRKPIQNYKSKTSGFYLLGGREEASPQTSQLPPPQKKVFPEKKFKSYFKY